MARNKRNLPSDKVLKRKVGLKKAKIKIFAFCEGKKTEPDYLTSFCSEYGNGLVEIVIVGAAGSPMTIVEKAVAQKKAIEKEFKKTGNSFDELVEVWVIYDIDEHPKLREAANMAKGNNLFSAISNPCFEIWPLWHCIDYNKAIHRHKLQSLLAKHVTEYNKKNKTFKYENIKEKYNDARTRAIKEENNNKGVGSPGANPSSDIYKLLDKIIDNGRLIKCQ